MSDNPAILGKTLLELLAPALNIDGRHVRRIVLDIPFDGPVTAYVEQLGDTRLIDIQWPPIVAVVVTSEDMKP